MSERIDDRDCEVCPECGVAPGYQGGCVCHDDGRGALPARFEALRSRMLAQNESLRRENWKLNAPLRAAAGVLLELVR